MPIERPRNDPVRILGRWLAAPLVRSPAEARRAILDALPSRRPRHRRRFAVPAAIAVALVSALWLARPGGRLPPASGPRPDGGTDPAPEVTTVVITLSGGTDVYLTLP